MPFSTKKVMESISWSTKGSKGKIGSVSVLSHNYKFKKEKLNFVWYSVNSVFLKCVSRTYRFLLFYFPFHICIYVY